VSPRSPARNGYPHAAIGPYADDITPCPRMTNKIYLQIQRFPPNVLFDMVLPARILNSMAGFRGSR
jgi:hypothetical protein